MHYSFHHFWRRVEERDRVIKLFFVQFEKSKMASASSSSGLEPNSAKKYDVFISFSGKDTRNNFTSHLHEKLKRASLEVFLDEEKLEKGDEIASSLIQAINDCYGSIIVFSEKYASSRWCLDELAQIMQSRKEEDQQFVIPIFYKVEPSNVRNIRETYKKAFEEHEKKYDPDRLKRWIAALSETANLKGWHCNTFNCDTFKDESNLIEEIVAVVNTKLEHIYKCQYASKGLIGIEKVIEPIEILLEKSHKVGIWGMGGVGKTTMAKEVFGRLSSKYSSRCFLENVREKTLRNGLEHVRNFLVSELLGEDKQSNSSNALRDNAYVARRLCRKKALVVLDDVNNSAQLTDLEENICNYLAEGSKVIITTREKQLLKANDYEIHEANVLSYDNSRQLFISKAFQQGHSKDGYEQLIEKFVHYTQHIPLALKVLGSCVRSKDKKFWDSLLKKLRDGGPNGEIQEVLRVSYDGLDHEDKKIFLDIACFLKGESKEFVKELLESYGFHSTTGIETLEDKALIMTTNGKVEMHDLIQEMGYQIVREENIDEAGKRSRLWDQKEIYNVLKNCEGKKVEGIIFYFNGTELLELASKTFDNMKKLRFLKIYHSHWLNTASNFTVPTTGLESISSEIRYFHWRVYPGKSLPSNFCAPLLLELNLEYSKVVTLWEGVQDLANLRRLKLSWCSELRELPDFSNANRLESVNLYGCKCLRCVHESLLCLHSLISLDVRLCFSLESLQSRIHLKSLKQVNAQYCFNLKEFSVSSEELTSLDLSRTKIEELRPSMGCWSKVRMLNLPNGIKLKNLPIDVLRCLTLEELTINDVEMNDTEGLCVLFDHLHSVQSLYLMVWTNLKELPDNITKLSGLEKLYLDGCGSLTKLPDNMRYLSQLQLLSVRECSALQSLPELPPSLRILDAHDCLSLGRVSISSTPANCGEKIFSFDYCHKLDFGTFEEQAMRLLENAVHEKEHVAVIEYPGKKFPKRFGENRTQHDLNTIQLTLSSHNLLGFVFYVVTPDSNLSLGDVHMKFSIEEDEMIHRFKEIFHSTMQFTSISIFNPGNVFLFFSPKISESIQEKIEGNRRNHETTTYNQNLTFRFTSTSWYSRETIIMESGVYPIYASEYLDLNFHSNKRKAKHMM